jgi:UTP:GlnB (protein PII) uridylyltransferase
MRHWRALKGKGDTTRRTIKRISDLDLLLLTSQVAQSLRNAAVYASECLLDLY